jgi:hypothetical protein
MNGYTTAAISRTTVARDSLGGLALFCQALRIAAQRAIKKIQV